ncbi:hypothetical protein GQ42DRAFT_144182 [Ramicandelaber brevisporus]|nr:hypothetical protein GQ42DRAFT_144182 [Ramicandelaber brevisporus]
MATTTATTTVTVTATHEQARAFLANVLVDMNTVPSASTLPWVTLTYAQSLDGRIGSKSDPQSPKQQLILSGPESLILTHHLRAMHDAILVGVGTCINDNPRLDARLVPAALHPRPNEQYLHPCPVIIDTHLRIPLDSNIVSSAKSDVNSGKRASPIVICSHEALLSEKKQALEANGVHVIGVDKDEATGHLDMRSALVALKNQCGVRSVMVEGGGGIINSLLQPSTRQIVSRVIITIAPIFLGDNCVPVYNQVKTDSNTTAGSKESRTVIDVYSSSDAQSVFAALVNNKWQVFGRDIVVAGALKVKELNLD